MLLNIVITIVSIIVIASQIEYILFDYKLGKGMYNEPFDLERYVINIMFILLFLIVPVLMWSR